MTDTRRPLLDSGDEFGGYRVEGYVASGGMAEVYRARHVSSAETVALKIIPPELAQNEQFRERFMRESTVATELRHRNIIPIYDAGEDAGALFLAMRYVDPNGYDRADLRAVLDKEGPLPATTALPLLEQVADALDLAHQHGLVHRDVTPPNILVERGDGRLEDSRAYLSDFGITRPIRTRSQTTTRTSGFVGTLYYAAPEQIRNEPANTRTDIYALGCVAYEMLTAQPPYGDRDHEAAVIFAILEDPVPKLTAHHGFGQTEFPATADDVLERALAKDPAERYSTAGELVEALRRALQPSEPPAPSEPPGRRRAAHRRTLHFHVRRWWIAVGVLLGAAALVAALLVWSPWTSPTSRYDGTHAEAPVAFTHPASWSEHLEAGSFMVFSPFDLRGLFAGRPDGWPTAMQQISDDRSQLAGVYVRAMDSTGGIGDPGSLQDALRRGFPSSRITWNSEAPFETVDGRKARSLTGTIRPPNSTDSLQIRAIVIELDPAPKVAELVFFGGGLPPNPSAFDQRQQDFQAILDSADTTP